MTQLRRFPARPPTNWKGGGVAMAGPGGSDGNVRSLVWHYTVGVHWSKIEKEGILRPATAWVPKGERPVVWFTRSESFEPTARKMVQASDGALRSLTVEETERRCKGLFRIGVDPEGLFTWGQWVACSGVDESMVAALADVAAQNGSDPDDWLVSFKPVPRDRWRSVEVWYRGRWSVCV